jgi:hypothetical protein
MDMKKPVFRVVRTLVIAGLIFQLLACGYIMYPERRGQKPVGRVDPAIAVLDALGLLVFIVPGVIAFAVDITNGTLYFPAGQKHSSVSTETDRITKIQVNPNELSETFIREMVEKQTGLSLGPDLSNVEIYELDRSENIEARLVELELSGYRVN